MRPVERSKPFESLPYQRLMLRLLRHPEQRPAKRLLARTHPADIAALWSQLLPLQRERVLNVLFELRLAGRVLRELPVHFRREAIVGLRDEQLIDLLTRLPVQDTANLIAELSEAKRSSLLANLDPARAMQIEYLLRFGSGTAGALMDPEAASFLGEETVAQTLDRIRSLAETRKLFYLYVVDERGHLIGIVNLWQLVSSAPERKLRDLLSPDVVTVRVDTQEEEVVRRFERYGLLVLPVVDEDGKLAGVISADDVLPVIDARSAQDLYRLANLNLEETVETPPFRSVRLRLPWLLTNLATAFLAAWVVSLFEATLAKYVVLASFMPIVAGMGGNAGTQTLTVVVRALALRQLEGNHFAPLVLRQALVGLTNGFVTGIVLALVAFVWERNMILSLVLFIAESVNLTVAGLFGALVPMLLQRLRLDPALGSSIFVTTATDVGGFLSFLGTATLLLELLTQ